MITVKYVTGTGNQTFILNESFDIAISECNPHSTKWTYQSASQQYGIDITSFGKNALTLGVDFKFRGAEIGANLEKFFRACEVDIINQTAGRLYFNDEYLMGYFVERDTTPSGEFYGYAMSTTFLAPHPFYIKETTMDFTAGGMILSEQLDYKYDYNYDYTRIMQGTAVWDVGHYTASDFLLTIHGAVENPQIYINGNLYKVYDDLLADETITINSRDNTITKINIAGLTENLYNNREKQYSVFTPIQSDSIQVNWSSTFEFTLTLYLERSEPTWN